MVLVEVCTRRLTRARARLVRQLDVLNASIERTRDRLLDH
jgi:hypothetical protein